MKFDKNLYAGLIRHPLLTVKILYENLQALTLNKKVGENYSLTNRAYKVAGLDEERLFNL
jgi:hypothetical protein